MLVMAQPVQHLIGIETLKNAQFRKSQNNFLQNGHIVLNNSFFIRDSVSLEPLEGNFAILCDV